MTSRGFIALVFLICFLSGCYTQKEIEAYARANPVSHVSSDCSTVGRERALLGRESLVGEWRAVSRVDWAWYGCSIWGIRKNEKAFDVTFVYDFKDNGHVGFNVSASWGQQRRVVVAKGQWTYDNGILKIRLGNEKWDNCGDAWAWAFNYVMQGIFLSELELQKDYWGNRNERIITWHGENTISMGWADVRSYQEWWVKFMRGRWQQKKSVTVTRIGDDGCWHMHSGPEDSVMSGNRLINAVWDRLIFRRVVPRMDEVKQQNKEEVVPKDVNALPNKPPYRIIDLAREKGSDFAYAFSLEMIGDASIQTFFGLQNTFASEVRAAYLMEYPSADVSALRVVVQPRLSNGRIVGRAEVLTITPVSLTYDPSTRNGKLAVKVNANQYEEARKWIRKNIETLARDKNIALTTGEIPPAAKFYLGREELKDGNILEIEFKTE